MQQYVMLCLTAVALLSLHSEAADTTQVLVS